MSGDLLRLQPVFELALVRGAGTRLGRGITLALAGVDVVVLGRRAELLAKGAKATFGGGGAN